MHTEDSATDSHANKTTALSPLETIDAFLKEGKWEDELGRAKLLDERETHYLLTGASSDNFIKDTWEKTGINRSVLQRVRRITRLPKEVMVRLAGTKIANRQDLLVQLSDRVVDMPELKMQLAAAQDLIDNPPAYGPRSTPKTASVDAHTATATAMMGSPIDVQASPRIEVLEGIQISMAFPDGEPRVQDLELGLRLGYRSKYKIRELVKELIAGGHLASSELLPAPGKSSTTTGRPGAERWLTEEQALFVTTQAGTPTARTITKQLIRAFIAARRLLNKPKIDDKLLDAINETIGARIISLQMMVTKVDGRLASLESSSGFGARPMLLVPQVDMDEAGYSMEALNKAFIEKGYTISESDTAIRAFAGKLGLIGDLTYGFWNAHSDRVNRSLSDSWRFNDAGAQALEAHVLSYCKRKMQYEEESQPAPRDRALKEVLDLISPIGNGEYALLTRTRTAKRQPFPTLRGPND